MILSSGKVFGKIGDQWKEERDNRVKNITTHNATQGATGQEIVPVNLGAREQAPTEKVAAQQIQVANKFVVLEVEDGVNEDNNELALVIRSSDPRNTNANQSGIGNEDNQLAMVEQSSHCSLKPNPTPTGK